MISKIIHYFFLSCLRATECVEKRLYYKLTWKEKIQMKVHMRVCKACAIYEQQSILIDKRLSKFDGITYSPKDVEMLKQKIKDSIDDL